MLKPIGYKFISARDEIRFTLSTTYPTAINGASWRMKNTLSDINARLIKGIWETIKQEFYTNE